MSERARFVPLPPRTMLPVGTRTVLLEVAVTVRFGPAVSMSPMVKGMGPVSVSSPTERLPREEIVGLSFTGVTVRVKEVVAPPELPSRTVNTMGTLPEAFVTGVSVTVRFPAPPPKLMLEVGIRDGFNDMTLKVSEFAAVSVSATVKGIVICVSSGVLLFVIAEIVGAVLLLGLTPTMKLWRTMLLLPRLSLTVTVIVHEPDELFAGRNVRVP